MLDSYSIIKRGNITLHYVGMDRMIAADTIDVLENSYNTLAGYHGLQDKKVLVRVIIAPSRTDYNLALSKALNLHKEVPSKPSEVLRVHVNDILLLSTFSYGQESTVKYSKEIYYKSLIDSMNNVFENFLAISDIGINLFK